MRSTRLRKFRRKHQWLIISLKTVLIFYIVLYSASYLTTDTVAYFDGKNVSNITIAAGTWEDKEDEDEEEREEGEKDSVHDDEPEDTSSLAFVTEDGTTQAKCVIEVQVINDGEGPMLSEEFYEVYVSEQGDPKIEGESVVLNEDEGIIPVLNKEEKISLTFEPTKNGMYRFVLYGNNDLPEDEWIWSDVFEINCLEEPEETNEEEKIEETPIESEEPEDGKEEDVGEAEEEGKEPEAEASEDISSVEDEEDVGEDDKEENSEVDE